MAREWMWKTLSAGFFCKMLSFELKFVLSDTYFFRTNICRSFDILRFFFLIILQLHLNTQGKFLVFVQYIYMETNRNELYSVKTRLDTLQKYRFRSACAECRMTWVNTFAGGHFFYMSMSFIII